jgi:hypothetical protein
MPIRFRFTFCLRTLFVFVTLSSCVAVGWLRLHHQRTERQRIAVYTLLCIYNAGVGYSGRWGRRLPLRYQNHFENVNLVYLESWGNVGLLPAGTRSDIPEICKHICSLPYVEELELDANGMMDDIANEFKERLKPLKVTVTFNETRQPLSRPASD